jgi:hypothetical protein
VGYTENAFGKTIDGPVYLSILIREFQRLPVILCAVYFEAAEFDFAYEVGAEGHGGHDDDFATTFTKEGFCGGNGGACFTGTEAVVDKGTASGTVQAEIFANELLVFIFLEGHLFTCLWVGRRDRCNFEIRELCGNKMTEGKTVGNFEWADGFLDFIFCESIFPRRFL